MRALQPLLQRGLLALDPWLDAIFPIATALICAKQRLAGYSLLAIYLGLRLLQRSDQEPWRWILVSLLVANAGLIVQDQDLKPGGASDYLIVALGFAAGFQRTRSQWGNALGWIASCAVPLLAFSIAAGDNLIQGTASFAGFNINKLGFLAGLLSVSAYGWFLQAQAPKTRILAMLLMILGISEAILTESRAAIVVPCIAIAAERVASHRWTIRRALMMTALVLAIASGTIYNWYLKSETNYSLATDYRLGEINRVETIQCWMRSTSQSSRSLWLGLGYGKPAQEWCGPEAIPSLRKMQKSQGLQHAHNFYAQIFAEAGLSGLILSIGLTCAGFGKAWQLHTNRMLPLALPLLIYLILMALGITFWQVMMINQVLVGYSLAALTAVDPDPCVADATIPETQPSASAPQG